MKTKLILAGLMIAMVITVGSAAVYSEYNSRASAEVTIEKTGDCTIETLVSIDGENFSESVILDNVSAGDTVVLTFSHRNTGDTEFIFGSVQYDLQCDEGLDFNTCPGSIFDFVGNDEIDPEPFDICQNVEYGIIHENVYGISYPVNTEEFISRLKDETVITPLDFQAFTDEPTYTSLIFTLNEHAFGTYEVGGTVETISFQDIPRPIRERINETIEL